MISQINSMSHSGLTTAEAVRRLQAYGMNQIAEEGRHPAIAFLRKFWGVIPWMLEITLILQFALGKFIDALIILVLLIVNAVIGFAFERKAQRSLALLQQQLQIQARVLRDGEWKLIPAQELVPGDIIRLRAGDLTPADVCLIDGAIAVDQSSLTGETELIEITTDEKAFAGSVIRRGEAIAEICATGIHTSYGKTASLVQGARPTDQGDVFVQKIVMYLLGFTGILVIGVLLDALSIHLPFADVLLFALALLIAAIPVSLPVTFTLASAVGARKLARNNVLTARLTAVKEAAGMDVLCTDKTGTITQNELTVTAAQTYNGYSKSKLLRLAALAADEAAHDPIDSAILNAAQTVKPRYRKAQRLEFIPFDPATKRTESVIHRRSNGKKRLRVVKGSPHIISRLTHNDVDFTADVERWAAEGNRCIAIAVGKPGKTLKTAGLLALRDEPREEAAEVVSRLHELGVRVIMITGDDLSTAQSIAEQVGITGDICTPETLHADMASAAAQFDIFARVYPEDKYRLVETLQSAGHIVGMTGDGINDAPAIRQAEIGIAMNNATDITKSAASLILTAPGLKDMLSAIEVGRAIFQRITTYTLNKIIKTFHVGLFLSLGLLLTGTLIVSPMHILLMVLANDLVSMSLTTDHVRPSPKPNRWRTTPLILSGLILAVGWLAFSFVVFFIGHDGLRLDADRLDTLMLVMLVFIAIANVYLIRERGLFWRSMPGKWLVMASGFDLIAVTFLATSGILMAKVDFTLILALLMATVGFMLLLDIVKVFLFRRFGIQQVDHISSPKMSG
jgi:H+-transporting ATPase